MWKSLESEVLARWTELQELYTADPLLAAGIAFGVLLHTFAWCRIFAKFGHSAAIGLVSLVPPLALLFPFLLAFFRSPAERELKTLRGIENVMRKQGRDELRRAA